MGLLTASWLLATLFVSLLGNTTLAALYFNLYRTSVAGETPELTLTVPELNPRLLLSRKRLVGLGAIGFVISITLGFALVNSVQVDDRVVIIAHRGASIKAPENSMAAIQSAIEDGADWVEIDVQETVDGEVVVFHDSDFMKLSGNPLKIWNATYDDLKRIDIGSWFSEEFKKERVIEIVESQGMVDQVVVMSLKMEAVERMKALRPDWTIGFLMSVSAGKLSNIKADFLAVNSAFVSRRFIQKAKKLNKAVYVWTINDAAGMSVAMSRGVDGIITDRPDLARRVLEQRANMTLPERLLVELAAIFGKKSEMGEQ